MGTNAVATHYLLPWSASAFLALLTNIGEERSMNQNPNQKPGQQQQGGQQQGGQQGGGQQKPGQQQQRGQQGGQQGGGQQNR